MLKTTSWMQKKKKNLNLKSLEVVWHLVALLRFWMEIRKLFVCAARWLNSGSKSTFMFLTKKCERLQCWFLGRPISHDCDAWTVFCFYLFIFPLLYFFGRCTCLQWHPRSCALFLFVPYSYKNVELAAFLNITWFHTHQGHRFSLFLYTRDCIVVLSSI